MTSSECGVVTARPVHSILVGPRLLELHSLRQLEEERLGIVLVVTVVLVEADVSVTSKDLV